MVELIVYNRIPHLLSPVVTELERVVPTLKWATRVRWSGAIRSLRSDGFRNIDSYKQAMRSGPTLSRCPYRCDYRRAC